MSLLTLKLRKRRPCAPIGPDFSKAERIELVLSGTKVSVSMNDHLPDGPHEEVIYPAREYNIFDSGLYEEVLKNIDETACYKGLYSIIPLRRCWSFRGPIFTGYAAQIDTTISILKVVPVQSEFSLFNPDNFQQFLLDKLTVDYGALITHGRSRFDAPVGWRVVKNLPVPAATFEITPVIDGGSRKVMFAFPVDHEIAVYFCFHLLQYEPGELSKKDAMVSPKPLYELVSNVISSAKIELSSSANQALNEIKSRHPEAKLAHSVKPLKWTTPEQDAEWEEFSKELAEMRRLSYSDQTAPKSEMDKLYKKMNEATTEEEMFKLMEQAAEMETKHSSQSKKS